MSGGVVRQWSVVNAEPMKEETVMSLEKYLPSRCSLLAPTTEDKAELKPLLSEADVLLVRSRRIDRELILAGNNLKLIQQYGTDVRHIDTVAAEEAGICVATLRMWHWVAVAEHVITLMLALAKRLVPSHSALICGDNPARLRPEQTSATQYACNWTGLPAGSLLYGKTAGIIGLGHIGREVASRCRALEMSVLYNESERLPQGEEDELGVRYAPLEELLSEADFVSLHVPQTSATEKLVGGKELALMKKTAFLINTARGKIVDQDALIQALSEGSIAGAGLDVFDEEPLLPSNELLAFKNVVLTPHTASAVDSLEAFMKDYYYQKYFENVLRVIEGEPPLRQVGPYLP